MKEPPTRLDTSLPAIDLAATVSALRNFARLHPAPRHSNLILRLTLCAAITAVYVLAADPTAAEFARRAEQARDSGQIVRAYLLYSQAAAREPHNSRYSMNRDALAPSAKVLATTDVKQDTDIAADVKEIESRRDNPEPPVELVSRSTWERDENLQPLPNLKPVEKSATFDMRGDERTLFQQVTAAYGLQAVFDPQLDPRPNLHFNIADVDFRTAMEALAAATGTFIFPVSEKQIFVARNTEAKRNQYEPQVLLTFHLPNALEQKDLVEAANAVRTVLNIRAIGWDSITRTVMVKDRTTRARIAYALLEAVLLPRSQVSLDVQIMTVDTDRSIHYGLALPTSYQMMYFGHIGGFQNVLPNFGTSALKFVLLGGGGSLFGLALGDSTFFATYTNSYSHSLFDATVVVSGGQTATLHIGDQYPIAQSLYTGYAQSAASIYNPVPQISMVDLGIVLKVSPRVGGDGNITMDVEAEYKALGNQTFNTVPTILQRSFKGSVNLREGEWAVIGGLDVDSDSVTRSGLIGLSQIPGVNQVLSENTRDRQTSRTLLVIKPTVTRLPMSASLSPQYLVGPQRGQAVLF